MSAVCPSKPKRLALILPHLGIGGAQRVAVTLADHWSEQGFDVHVITTLEHKDDFYELGPLVKRRTLRRAHPSWAAAGPTEPRPGLLARTSKYFDQRLTALRAESNRLPPEPHKELSESGGLVLATREYVDRYRPLPTPLHQIVGVPRRVVRLAVVFNELLSSGDVKLIAAAAVIYPARVALKTGRALRRRARKTSRTALSWASRASVYCIDNHAFGVFAKPYLSLLRITVWRVPALRSLLREIKPDVVLSFLGATNIITIAAAKDLPSRVVISERNDPSRQQLDPPWEGLRPIIYPSADVVTANSHGAVEHLRRYCASTTLAYVPNPVVIPDEGSRQQGNSILFLARLVHQKGPDILIDGFARFAKDNPDWSLEIAGDGPMSDELLARVRGYRLENRVIFHGLVKDPTPLLERARIFALPSRFEGTPNALLEAMAAKLACVVTNTSPGPLKLVEHEVTGLVIDGDDPEGLALAFHRLARDNGLQEKLAQASWERTAEYRIENVARQWEQLFS